MFEVTVDSRALVSALAGLPTKLRASVIAAISQATRDLRARVEEKLSGEVLNSRSGALRASIVETGAVAPGAMVSDSVGSDGSVPYARIQEYGGRIAIPEIVPHAAKVLAFSYGGRLVFTERTAAHAVDIPERSYLLAALEDESAAIIDAVRAATTESLA